MKSKELEMWLKAQREVAMIYAVIAQAALDVGVSSLMGYESKDRAMRRMKNRWPRRYRYIPKKEEMPIIVFERNAEDDEGSLRGGCFWTGHDGDYEKFHFHIVDMAVLLSGANIYDLADPDFSVKFGRILTVLLDAADTEMTK